MTFLTDGYYRPIWDRHLMESNAAVHYNIDVPRIVEDIYAQDPQLRNIVLDGKPITEHGYTPIFQVAINTSAANLRLMRANQPDDAFEISSESLNYDDFAFLPSVTYVISVDIEVTTANRSFELDLSNREYEWSDFDEIDSLE